MAARSTRPPVPADWHVSEVARVRGQVLTPGRQLRISGQRGTFAFLRHVVNTRTGGEWIDVRDANGALRAFREDRVTRVVRASATARRTRPARTAVAA